MKQSTTRHAFALDLVDDPASISAYEKAHEVIWPEVVAHLHRYGVVDMEIYRLGTRLFMVMEVDSLRYDAQAMSIAAQTDPIIARWEESMGIFQRTTPWTPPGAKWTLMKRIFCLSSQKGEDADKIVPTNR